MKTIKPCSRRAARVRSTTSKWPEQDRGARRGPGPVAAHPRLRVEADLRATIVHRDGAALPDRRAADARRRRRVRRGHAVSRSCLGGEAPAHAGIIVPHMQRPDQCHRARTWPRLRGSVEQARADGRRRRSCRCEARAGPRTRPSASRWSASAGRSRPWRPRAVSRYDVGRTAALIATLRFAGLERRRPDRGRDGPRPPAGRLRGGIATPTHGLP